MCTPCSSYCMASLFTPKSTTMMHVVCLLKLNTCFSLQVNYICSYLSARTPCWFVSVASESRWMGALASYGRRQSVQFSTPLGPMYPRCKIALSEWLQYINWRIVKEVTWHRNGWHRYFRWHRSSVSSSMVQSFFLSSSILLQHGRFHVLCLHVLFSRRGHRNQTQYSWRDPTDFFQPLKIGGDEVSVAHFIYYLAAWAMVG